MPAGRPTLYEDRFVEEIIEYFSEPPYTVLPDGKHVATDMKTLAGFAIKIGVAKDTLYEWSKAVTDDGTLKHPEFSAAYKRAKDFQENYIAVNGNKSLIHPQFGMFTAKNVIGWNDGKQADVSVNVNNNLASKSDEDVEKRVQELLEKAQAAKPKGEAET